MANFQLDPDEFRPLVRLVVEEVMSELARQHQLVNGRMALSESEAAELLGLNAWQLRDLRLEGKVSCSRIVGRRIRYTLADLQQYLDTDREDL